MIERLNSIVIDNMWTISLIQGYVGYFNIFLMGKKLDFFLIARRAFLMGGTRYNARGIDDQGNVANYNEVEQIIYYSNYCFSHVQVRGSVPVFFSQNTLIGSTTLKKDFESSNPAFLKHMDDLKNDYHHIFCVNLMKKHKKAEQIITEAYENHIKSNEKYVFPFLRYEYFDLHSLCGSQNYENVNPLIKKMYPIIENFKYFALDMKQNTVTLNQKGVVRTNCMDCLDRTNIFQNKIALAVLDLQLQKVGINLTEQFGEDPFLHQSKNDLKKTQPLMVHFKQIWAQMGDMISIHYTGTRSTHSDVTKKGERTMQGMLQHGTISFERFIYGNFQDNAKQQAIDIIIGNNINKQLVNKEKKQNEKIQDKEENNYK